MRTPQTSSDFVMYRRGLRDHLLRKKLTFPEYGFFSYIVLAADPRTAILHSNSTILSSETCQPRKLAQHALYQLRAKKYIHYSDTRGMKGPHKIFIDKYPAQVDRRSERETPVWFSSIWDQNGDFIGEKFFLGRIKVRNLASIWHIRRDILKGISISGFGLSPDFYLDFTSDFQQYQESLDILGSCAPFCVWLSDFSGALDRDFSGTFENTPIHIQIHIHKKALKHPHKKKHGEKAGDSPAVIIPTEAEKKEIARLCDELKCINHGFKPLAFVQYCINQRRVTSVIIETLRRGVEEKDNSKIENMWGYLNTIAEEKDRKLFDMSIFRSLERGQD